MYLDTAVVVKLLVRETDSAHYAIPTSRCDRWTLSISPPPASAAPGRSARTTSACAGRHSVLRFRSVACRECRVPRREGKRREKERANVRDLVPVSNRRRISSRPPAGQRHAVS